MSHAPLHSRVALITGASRRNGIGAATCRMLAAVGADICFTHWQAYDRTQYEGIFPSDITDLLTEIRAHGVSAEAIEIDLSEPAAPIRLLDETTSRLGQPSILVNNAAYSVRDGYERLDAAALDAHYAVNMRATFLLTVELARRHQTGSGRIINLTSGQSLGAMPGELAYAATKGAIEAFTMSLAPAIAGKGITINAIDPGATDTGWMSPEFKQEILPHFPLGRLGQPEDAARLIAFLASDDAAWITGQVIHSRGGA